jgi:NAD(P)H-nitrite reductase large subunit
MLAVRVRTAAWKRLEVENGFQYRFSMATTPVEARHARDCRNTTRVRAMTRCECADVSFAEMAARIDEGEHLDAAARATGCGQTCTACWPDLERYLLDHRR